MLKEQYNFSVDTGFDPGYRLMKAQNSTTELRRIVNATWNIHNISTCIFEHKSSSYFTESECIADVIIIKVIECPIVYGPTVYGDRRTRPMLVAAKRS